MPKQNSNRRKRIELWAESIKNILEIWTPFPPRDIRKFLAARARVCRKLMAQFVLKLEKLSHIIGTAPILEMARAYGLRPRLWLLVYRTNHKDRCTYHEGGIGGVLKVSSYIEPESGTPRGFRWGCATQTLELVSYFRTKSFIFPRL